MDAFLDRLLADPLAELSARHVLDWAMQRFYAFTLVLVRMSGLMTIGPLFGQSVVPANVRILLVLTMSVLIVPTLGDQSRQGFQRLDADGDGRLTRDEVPSQLEARFDGLLTRAGKDPDAGLTLAEFQAPAPMPSSLVEYAWVGIGEFALGLVLGLGVLIILSGLQLAGELADQQSGISLGEISNPGLEISGSVTGQFLFLLGVTLLLVLEPLGGHLMMVAALVETFQTLPVGEAFLSPSAIDLLRDLVHQSFLLGIQAAAPLLAAMSLVALTMGFLGHTVPQINVLVVGFPVRALINLVILTAALTGMGRVVVDTVPEVIDTLRQALTGLS